MDLINNRKSPIQYEGISAFQADICQVKRTVSDFRGVWGLSQKHSSGNEWIRYRYCWGRYGASSAIAKARLSAIKETDCL